MPTFVAGVQVCFCAGFSSVQEIPRFMVLALVLVMVFVIISAAVG